MRLHVSNSLVHFSISLLNCFELRDIVSFSIMLITEVVKILDRRIQFVRNCKTNKLKMKMKNGVLLTSAQED